MSRAYSAARGSAGTSAAPQNDECPQPSDWDPSYRYASPPAGLLYSSLKVFLLMAFCNFRSGCTCQDQMLCAPHLGLHHCQSLFQVLLLSLEGLRGAAMVKCMIGISEVLWRVLHTGM